MQACFDDTKGGLALGHCADAGARAELEGGPALRCSHYLALGAAGALLHFLEQATIGSLLPLAPCLHCFTLDWGMCWESLHWICCFAWRTSVCFPLQLCMQNVHPAACWACNTGLLSKLCLCHAHAGAPHGACGWQRGCRLRDSGLLLAHRCSQCGGSGADQARIWMRTLCRNASTHAQALTAGHSWVVARGCRACFCNVQAGQGGWRTRAGRKRKGIEPVLVAQPHGDCLRRTAAQGLRHPGSTHSSPSGQQHLLRACLAAC